MGETFCISIDVLSGHVVVSTDLCLCVCVYLFMRENDTEPSEWLQIAWKHHFALFNSLYGDYTKRNVIGVQALYHCLALSIKLTTIPNPLIVHAERLLSATVSWQSGENEHSLLFSNNLITKQYKRYSAFLSFFPSLSSLYSSPCTQPCLLLPLPLLLPLLLFSRSWLLSSLT